MQLLVNCISSVRHEPFLANIGKVYLSVLIMQAIFKVLFDRKCYRLYAAGIIVRLSCSCCPFQCEIYREVIMVRLRHEAFTWSFNFRPECLGHWKQTALWKHTNRLQTILKTAPHPPVVLGLKELKLLLDAVQSFWVGQFQWLGRPRSCSRRRRCSCHHWRRGSRGCL